MVGFREKVSTELFEAREYLRECRHQGGTMPDTGRDRSWGGLDEIDVDNGVEIFVVPAFV